MASSYSTLDFNLQTRLFRILDDIEQYRLIISIPESVGSFQDASTCLIGSSQMRSLCDRSGNNIMIVNHFE